MLSLSLGDVLTLAGLLTGLAVPVVLYFKRRIDTVTDNHLAHLQEAIREDHQALVVQMDTQHKAVMGAIEHLGDDLQRVERKVDGHIEAHAEGAFDRAPVRARRR